MTSTSTLSQRYLQHTSAVLNRRARDLDLYRDELQQRTRHGDRVLHLGCGWDRSAVTAPLRSRAEIIGLDLDPTAAARYHSRCFVADAAKLPFADASFDVVCSEYVFEHVSNPQSVLSELARVIRPGGSLVALTPNRWSYKSVAAACTPHWFHRFSAARLRPDARSAEDVYPTHYKMNTRASLHELIAATSLEVSSLVFVNNGPTWFRHMPGIFELGELYHRALDHEALASLRCGILATFRKTGTPSALRGPLLLRCTRCDAPMLPDLRCSSCSNSYREQGNLVFVMA